MSIRMKMMLIFFCLATLPLVTLWGAHKDLQKKATQDFLSFMEGTFVDWTDGEFESISLDASIHMREKILFLNKVASYQANLLERELLTPEGKVENVWQQMSLSNFMGFAESTLHQVSLLSGEHSAFPKEGYSDVQNKVWYQNALKSKEIITLIDNDAGTFLEPEFVLAKSLKNSNGRVLGVSSIHFKLPGIFPSKGSFALSNSTYRNSSIEGFLLSVDDKDTMNVIVTQRRDYRSPALNWNIPFLPDTLDNKKEVIEKIKQKVLREKRIYIVKTALGGERYLWSFSPVGDDNIVLAILKPLETVNDQVGVVTSVGETVLLNQQNKFMLVWGGSILFAVIISLFCSFFFVRRLKKLIYSINRAEEGAPFAFEHEGGGDEISDLSYSIESFMRHQKEKDAKPPPTL
ncbi:MAG: hypothetical protein ACI8QY_000268 [bacterium]|jgi:hypothetical protein